MSIETDVYYAGPGLASAIQRDTTQEESHKRAEGYREISTARPSAHPLEAHVAFLNNEALRNVLRDKKRQLKKD